MNKKVFHLLSLKSKMQNEYISFHIIYSVHA